MELILTVEAAPHYPRIRAHLMTKTAVSDACISVITKSELLYGLEVSTRRQQDDRALTAFLRYVKVLDFPDEAAPHYATMQCSPEGERNHD